MAREIFRLSCLVEDKNLAKVLRSLSGVAFDVEPIPVVNATINSSTKKVSANIEGARAPDLLLEFLKKEKKTTFDSKDVSSFLSSIGRSPQSTSYTISQLVKMKMVKRVGKPGKGQYGVI